MDIMKIIEDGNTVLGLELGSTRIKAVLTDTEGNPVDSGSFGWENSNKDGIWTYPLEQVWEGISASYRNLKNNIRKNYNISLSSFKAGGFSAMMHGYLVFDRNDQLLTPFRTWRNNITAEASEKLTNLFQYPVPQRWSIAHLYQAILNNEEHIKDIAYMTTLSGYVHWKLTGRKVLGIGDASGMFPIEIDSGNYDEEMLDKFDSLISSEKLSWEIRDILPEVLKAGDSAGELTDTGAALIDPDGILKAGIPLCPPEGDAGTGMVATNSIRVKTGNVSAGTSVFAMLVMEKKPEKLHSEIDLVTTPDGKLVGMAHSNNCTSDYDAWIGLFGEAAESLGADFSTAKLYDTLLGKALESDPDAGGLLTYSYISGEHITGFSEGRPLFVRKPESNFTLSNFMRSLLYSSLCALRAGLNVLIEEEGVEVKEIRGHGGFFKTPETGQRIMAAATGIPVSLLETSGEGGAWGMALLASYLLKKETGISLTDFVDKILKGSAGKPFKPLKEDIEGFNKYFQRYMKGLDVERSAVENLD